MGDLSKALELHTQTAKDRINFLEADLAISNTFIAVAKTEFKLNQLEAARSALAKAEDVYATVGRFLEDVKDAECQSEIARKLSDLRMALDEASAMFGEATSA